MRDISLYLQDILEAMIAIEMFVGGMGFEEFKDDDKTTSAVIRKFEIIGEASKQIPDDVRLKHPLIPWKDMAGMRDRLIHFYFGIKYELIWHTIKDVIPVVKPALQDMLKDISNKLPSSDKKSLEF